jgi:hypothetical protein
VAHGEAEPPGSSSKHEGEPCPTDDESESPSVAEALIRKYLPIEALLGIVSYTQEVDAWLKAEIFRLGKNVNANVLRNRYFT